MGFNTVWDRAGIPLLTIAVCGYYLYQLGIKKDLRGIRSKYQRELYGEEKEAFIKEGVRLLALMIAGVLLEIVCSMISPWLSIIEITVVVVAEVLLWKKLAEKYQ